MNRGISAWAAVLALSILTSLTSGCARNTRGPILIANSHVPYNKVINQVISEELLLNVVRRRYAEPPQFVTISSIVSNVNTSTSVGIGAQVGKDGNVSGGASANAGVSFSDNPTVTFTPRSGSEIAGPLHEPIDVDQIAYLANANYTFDLLLTLVVQDIGSVLGPEPDIGAGFRGGSKESVELLRLVQELLARNELVVGNFRRHKPYSERAYEPKEVTTQAQVAAVSETNRFYSVDGNKTYQFTEYDLSPALWIDPETREPGGIGARVVELLEVQTDPLTRLWFFEPKRVLLGTDLRWQSPDDKRDVIRMRTRSFYGVLNYLSYGVRVPADDEKTGRSPSTAPYRQAVDEDRAYDIGENFVIQTSKKAPDDAYVAVQHRDRWFYIADTDHMTKRIFGALYDLFNLQVAQSNESKGPVLTLPVN